MHYAGSSSRNQDGFSPSHAIWIMKLHYYFLNYFFHNVEIPKNRNAPAKKCRFDASLITAPPNIVWTTVPTVTAAFVYATVAL